VIESRAFENIDDPADPAWAGHAEAAPPRAWRLFACVTGLLVAMAAAVTAVVLTDSSAPTEAQPAISQPLDDAPRATAAPHATPALQDASVADAQSPIASEPPSEAELMQELLARNPPKLYHANLAGVGASRKVGISGDLSGLEQSLFLRLDTLAKRERIWLDVISGERTRGEQIQLYRAFQNGTGNLAAPPGKSMHEHGRAADVYVNGVALASVPGAAAAARELGLGFPVPGEPWHVEVVAAA
jgi:hypothetical protein